MSLSSCSNNSSIVCMAMAASGCNQGATEQTRERDLDPIGPVVQLVPKLVEGFIQNEDLQQRVDRVLRARQEGCLLCRGAIRAEECRGDNLFPQLGPRR